MTNANVSYNPGDWVAMSRGDGWILVQLPLIDQRIRTLWASLVVSTDHVLDALLSEGVRALPGFALLRLEEQGLRCVVRKPAQLLAEAAAISEKYEGISPWLDTLISPAPDRVTVYGADPADVIELPMLEGIVRAGRLTIEPTPVQVADLQASSMDRRVSFAASGDSDETGAPRPQPAVVAAEADAPGPVESATIEPVAATPATVDPAAVEPAESRAEGPPPAAVGQQSTYYKLLSLDTTARQALLSQLRANDDAAADEPAETSAVPTEPPAANSVGFGGEQRSPVSEEPPTAINQVANPGTAATAGRSSDVTDGVPWLTGTSGMRATDAKSTMGTAAQPVAPIPGSAASSLAGAVPSKPRKVNLSAMTTSRSAMLRELAEGTSNEPKVFAYRCGQGHLSATTAVTCRICGERLPEQQPVQVVRPALGQLSFSNGLKVALDRNVIFGRDPQPTGDDMPNLIKPIDSEELSRMHASVTIAGWRVTLRDLGSTNGTFLALPGEPLNRLNANEDYPLEPGYVVSLAEIVSFTYEPLG